MTHLSSLDETAGGSDGVIGISRSKMEISLALLTTQ